MSIILILLIVYAIYIFYKSKNEKKLKTRDIKEINKSKPTNTNDSYYSTSKVNSYRKMNQDHFNHDDIKDISDSIGYKRCPNCGSTVSKKSTTCFMCDYEFIDNSNE